MDFKLELPIDILPIVFQYLDLQDLVNCSRTCWCWNADANTLLYKAIIFSSLSKLVHFVESIGGFHNSHEMCVKNNIDLYKPLGHLVKSVEITASYYQYDDRHNYSTILSRLATVTPNVHGAMIYLPIITLDADRGKLFNWSLLGLKWSKLTRLSLRDISGFSEEAHDIYDINDVLNKLQYLSIARCNGILTHMLPSLPTMPYLQFLKIGIDCVSDYHALKRILHNCQDTLHTLLVCFEKNSLLNSFDVDDLNIGSKKLKTFELCSREDLQFFSHFSS
ncbi:hypothetical protein INT44_008978 [Umbelopsis vinacea]|uniref:F-box domain-containing protein n=1 Tax=Umbelopsis vinacea TaxID=44442 RepID=A0A8H7UJG7_9FUNG|nr:hypothetical protein INT44_008978 [Umbelopsis vinacea]